MGERERRGGMCGQVDAMAVSSTTSLYEREHQRDFEGGRKRFKKETCQLNSSSSSSRSHLLNFTYSSTLVALLVSSACGVYCTLLTIKLTFCRKIIII